MKTVSVFTLLLLFIITAHSSVWCSAENKLFTPKQITPIDRYNATICIEQFVAFQAAINEQQLWSINGYYLLY